MIERPPSMRRTAAVYQRERPARVNRAGRLERLVAERESLAAMIAGAGEIAGG